MPHRLAKAVGILLAPAIYGVGRLVRSPGLSAHAIKFDGNYLRGYSSRLQAHCIQSEAFFKLCQAAKLCASTNISLDADILHLVTRSHGQLLQDVLCTLVHKGKHKGYFVEVGVGDGTKYSNTLMLERDYGWHGILVEPATTFHDSITTSRKAIVDVRAVTERSGDVVQFEQDDSAGEYSGLSSLRTPRGKQILSKYEVGTVCLDDLLDEYNAPGDIDYISIDTEGSELSVLRGLSMSKRRIWLFTIEHNFDTRKRSQYLSIFRKAGYRRILPRLSEFDDWYIHRDLDCDYF